MIHIHRGKGAKDRHAPLPEFTSTLLRRYWATHRNPRLIFPAVGRGQQKALISQEPMSIDGVQGAFRREHPTLMGLFNTSDPLWP